MNEERTETCLQVEHIRGHMTYPFKWRLNLVQVNTQGLIDSNDGLSPLVLFPIE